MPINEKKIGQIIRGECQSIEERCNGYKDELIRVITDILEAENQHRVQSTNIQQQITHRCRAAGDFLVENRNLLKSETEEIQ